MSKRPVGACIARSTISSTTPGRAVSRSSAAATSAGRSSASRPLCHHCSWSARDASAAAASTVSRVPTAANASLPATRASWRSASYSISRRSAPVATIPNQTSPLRSPRASQRNPCTPSMNSEKSHTTSVIRTSRKKRNRLNSMSISSKPSRSWTIRSMKKRVVRIR